MTEFKFFCPRCGKQIQCDTNYCGSQINCPACQQPITVPPPASPAAPIPQQSAGSPAGKPPAAGNRKPFFVFAAVVALIFFAAGVALVLFPQLRGRPAGLAAYWPAEGNARDKIGHHNGTMIDGAGYDVGEVGRAFSFDGKGQYVKIPPSAGLNPGGQLTIEFWMKAAPGNPVSSFQGLVTSDYYGVEIANGVSFYVSSDHGGSWAISPHASLSAGVWHHVAGTYDGAIVRLYIDGQPLGMALKHIGAISPLPSGSFVAIGSEDGRTQFADCVGSRYFNGLIDEVRIYDRALSASEIKAIYDKR